MMLNPRDLRMGQTHMRRALLFIGGGLAVLVAMVAAVPFLVDANQFRGAITEPLEKRLHAKVSLGNMKLSVIPFAIRIADVEVGQPEGYTSPNPLVKATEVYVGVSALALLKKEVKIEGVRLSSPKVELIRNVDGKWNYETRDEQERDASSNTLSLDELRVDDGSVAMTDLKAKTPRDAYEHIDLVLKNFGPERKGSVKGTVKIDAMAAALTLDSSLDNSTDAVSAKGTAELKSDRLKDPLSVAFDVKLDRKSQVLTVNALKAQTGAVTAAISGTIDNQASPGKLALEVKTANAPIADLIHLAALAGNQLPQDLKVTGNLTADIGVTGTTASPEFRGNLQASQAEFSSKELKEPVRASALQVSLTPELISTQPFTLETGRTRLTAQGSVKNYASEAARVTGSLRTDQASVEELLRIASVYGAKPPGMDGSGMISVDMNFTSEGKALSYSGSGMLKNVHVTSASLPKPLDITTADLKFADDRIAMQRMQAALGSMHVSGDLSVKDFRRPNLAFTADIDQVNVNELREWKFASAGTKSSNDRSIERITANGSLGVGKLIYDTTTMTNVKAQVRMANGLLQLDPIKANVFGGSQAGAITADLHGIPATYTIKSKLTGVDSNQLLSSTSSLKNVLSGPLSGTLDLQFQSKPNEDIAKTLNGKLQLQVLDGRLQGIQILNEMARIGRFLGFAPVAERDTKIVKLGGTLNIVNGLANTNDLLLDFGNGSMTGAGQIGLVDQSLKLRITTVLAKEFASKFGSNQIGGLLTTVLANQKGEFVVPAIVSGSFGAPKFAPDAEQVGRMKLQGLLPTASNPTAPLSGIKSIVDAFKKPDPNAKPADPNAKPDANAPAQQDPAAGIVDIFKSFKKKRPEEKKP